VEGAAPFRFFNDRLLGLFLGAYKKDVFVPGSRVLNEIVGFFEHFQCLLQIDNVDTVSRPENVRFHLGVPAFCLVSEMDAGFQQLFNG
jgi:hypothetical protein